jgi:NTP pyrophosphatase (non-canonical NTP hydrolase)
MDKIKPTSERWVELGQMIDILFIELKRAEEKFPGWPRDPVHGAAIMAEEAGELQKAALDFYYERHVGIDEMKKEAAQTAAMGLRFLLGLAYYYSEFELEYAEREKAEREKKNA